MVAALNGLRRERPLVSSSFAVLVGFGFARALGFLFQVTAGRALSPDGYGQLTYALAVANVAAVLITTAPLGLSRFLSRSGGDRQEQELYYVNWMATIGLVLGFSAVVTAAFATRVGLGGWLLIGLLANLLGAAALETYREVQRGLEHYVRQAVFYVLANAVQLVVVLVASSLDFQSPSLFLVVYGLSSLAALVLMAPSGGDLRLDLGALRWRRMVAIVGFMRPVLLQAVFWNVWFNADLILLQHFRSAAETGTYAAAKTIANGFTLAAAAVAFVVGPRVSRLPEGMVRAYLARALGLTVLATVPLALAAAVLAGPLTTGLFGGRYAGAAAPLVVLLVGAVLFGLRSVLDSMWLGLGHPIIEMVGSGAGMVVTLGVGLWTIPKTGAMGAAVAFSAGALTQLVVEGAVAVWAFSTQPPRVGHLRDRHLMAEERVQSSAAAGATVLVAEELAAAPDEDYESFVRTLKASLSARRPTLLLATAGGRWDGWPPVRMLNRTWQLIRAARSVDFRAAPPAVVIYVPRSPLTLPALLRARLLRWLCGGSPVALLTLEASVGQWLPEVLLRWLAPDLLLVPTERERHAADRLGVVAATISGGVDLDRFRPSAPGERPALRHKWRLSPTDRIVLHVGQLREGRNLRLMAALGAVPGVTAVVVASSPRGRESERLHRELWARGVIVIDGSLPEVEELYRLADCYVFPSISPAAAPALPLSILEALACDLPVVSTAFVALPERFGRVPGLDLVEHPALLPERVIAACGSAVRTRHLVEPYSWDAVAGRLEGLVSELYDRGRGAGSSVVGAA